MGEFIHQKCYLFDGCSKDRDHCSIASVMGASCCMATKMPRCFHLSPCHLVINDGSDLGYIYSMATMTTRDQEDSGRLYLREYCGRQAATETAATCVLVTMLKSCCARSSNTPCLFLLQPLDSVSLVHMCILWYNCIVWDPIIILLILCSVSCVLAMSVYAQACPTI